MLPKPYRLKKEWHFQKVIESKQKTVNASFVIWRKRPKNQKYCRFGIAIPQRLVKGSVARNYYKRQIRSMLALFLRENGNGCQKTSKHSHSNLVIVIRYP